MVIIPVKDHTILIIPMIVDEDRFNLTRILSTDIQRFLIGLLQVWFVAEDGPRYCHVSLSSYC